MQNFKDLLVWQKGHALVLTIYVITKKFPRDEQFGLTDQLRRSIKSVPTNIAEGCGRLTSPDFLRFLGFALGSANESEYHLLLSKDLDYISKEEFLILEKEINEIKAMLIALIKKIRGS